MPPPQPRHLRQPNRRLDPKIWLACAGAAVQIPRVHSRVYYFPQGHVEHASHSPHYLSHVLRSQPFIPCRVSAVDFLADPVSDEVFAKILLTPVADRFNEPPEELGDCHGAKVVSFAKILTPSDANNGGGFSVPRFCADSIFPKLDFDADPPVQVLSVTDVHGVSWQFRHIYRGTPRRHLLTTGWSKFVNHKQLVAGDSVVFMKNSRGQMFAGIRRSSRFAGAWRNKVEDEQQKVVASAAQKLPFEVVYYPKAGWPDFVVKAEVVEEAMKSVWCPGMKVKMAMETEDCSRMTWFQGTVSSVSASDNGPWRMLQVNWDEPEVLQNAKRVSPWQVELVSFTPALHRTFPPTKKFRFGQGSGLLSDREGDPLFPMTGFPNSTIGHLNQTLLSYDTFPAGMQGARHDLFSASSFSNSLNDNSCLHMGSSSLGNDAVPRSRTVSTELNIGSSQSDELSPDRPESQSSLHSFGTEFSGTHNSTHNSLTTKVGSGSIRLFGKIIQPVQSGLHDADCMRDHGSKGCNETEGIDNPLDHSLTYSKLHSRLDVQCQRASPVEASYF